mmetsp:Transcript_14832/g.41989  ORF Transcript_14832/g.41989 Transcript_14832/m.41989 type:complete len:242 (-) Transcript_14832:206-931(-)
MRRSAHMIASKPNDALTRLLEAHKCLGMAHADVEAARARIVDGLVEAAAMEPAAAAAIGMELASRLGFGLEAMPAGGMYIPVGWGLALASPPKTPAACPTSAVGTGQARSTSVKLKLAEVLAAPRDEGAPTDWVGEGGIWQSGMKEPARQPVCAAPDMNSVLQSLMAEPECEKPQGVRPDEGHILQCLMADPLGEFREGELDEDQILQSLLAEPLRERAAVETQDAELFKMPSFGRPEKDD